jgi:hypothetical protein
MAQNYVSTEGSQVTPGATVGYKVQTATSGLATSGVVMLVGEADAGPDWTLEESLQDNSFGPDEGAAVVAKYGSGPIVDGFNAVKNPLNDPNVIGAVSRVIIAKSNVSTKASASLAKYDTTSWATVLDKGYGTRGNASYTSVAAKTAEVVPTTGSFTWIPNVGSVNAELRANGGAALSLALSANRTPAQLVTAVDALSGVAASGGAPRSTITASTGTLTVAAPGSNVITITYSGSTFTTTPSIGDTVTIPTGSVIAGAADANVGAYVVTASTTAVITAKKLSDAGKGGAVAGTVTAPAAVSAVAVSGTAANDMVVFASVTISIEAGNPLDGVGKSLEIAELSTGTDLLSRCAYALGTTAVTWISKTGAAKLLTSAAEYRATMSSARIVDSLSEDLTAGGEIGLKISYQGTSASAVVSATQLVITRVGGSGGDLTITLSSWPTIGDMAAFISTQTGYSCSAGAGALASLPPTALDKGTYTIGTTWGAQTGRLKVDAYKMFQKVSQESVLIQIGNPATAPSTGLPAPTTAPKYLTGGARGGTTAAQFTAAVDALEKVRGNFLVPLFSRDASADIADGLTDSTSTYQIDAIHAYCRSHVLAMSKLKRRRNRQAMLSVRGTFEDAKAAAANVNSFRCSMSFLDQKVVGSDSTVGQKHPYIDACLAAGGQAAGFYKALVRKVKNVSGSLQAAGDWSGDDDTQVEDALLAGLLPTRRHELGGYYFVSDQTTYTKDSNFVYNSIQAVYVADTIALSLAQQMEDAFAGQSQADVTASMALTKVEAIMADFMRLKLIAPSDDASLGFKNARVTIQSGAMIVDLEVKLAGTIYFIPISFLVSQITQTATQG